MIRPASILRSMRRTLPSTLHLFARSFSATPPSLTKLTIRPDGVAVIEMNRSSSPPFTFCPPSSSLLASRPAVNSLNRELMSDLTKSLIAAAEDKSAKAVVLTSSKFGIFSAGLDINEMIITGQRDSASEDRLFTFWTTLQDLWLQLYALHALRAYVLCNNLTRYAHPQPVVAAINGHAPAGGCLLSMSCDWRIMSSGPFKIGLNETQLGIAAPLWFGETLTAIVGQRQTEKLLQVRRSLFERLSSACAFRAMCDTLV